MTAQRHRPNVVVMLADQWRAQATGFAGDPNVRTPNLDRLAAQSTALVNAVSTTPVCSPMRASLITGQYPLTHGIFVNDVCLEPKGPTIAEAFRDAGYATGYIGKWHLDGHGRMSYIPPERRHGFDFWRVLECTHRYWNSPYFAEGPERLNWNGYDAFAQTDEAGRYITEHRDDQFFLILSWGPPHNPYETAPEQFKEMYDPAKLTLRPNVPPEAEGFARDELAGYYAHCTALDHCAGQVMEALEAAGIADDTILVFTSDHGDMLGSQGERRKQRPWAESVRVPFVGSWPSGLGQTGKVVQQPVGSPDIMPTLLGLADVPVPSSVEGADRSATIAGRAPETDEPVLIMCPSPFGEWRRPRGGREYRGIQSGRWTYVRDLNGPWLLYDNEEDPYQMRNLVADSARADVQSNLDAQLSALLALNHDDFRSGWEYIQTWGYETDEHGTVPYTD